ncbi:MAG: sodium/proton-translocating pyrophosphatase [Deinococcales bacterium]
MIIPLVESTNYQLRVRLPNGVSFEVLVVYARFNLKLKLSKSDLALFNKTTNRMSAFKVRRIQARDFSPSSSLSSLQLRFILLWRISQTILKADTGNERMGEISDAIKQGAMVYMNRQTRTIAICCGCHYGYFYYCCNYAKGTAAITWWWTTIGLSLLGHFSGISGYIGMNIAVVLQCRWKIMLPSQKKVA